ncbi:uncharacterized protein E0L32_007611 [Thyridium curvatum]|uniref:Major facilitator superfamily (MFS) profile domain-containing protein n=1 Tax=Thyridium curvatum TaxID=1093900 RepID=A0A507ANZ9_9PEZI|nr:uncharacterized protein E0L32_007611 [Thyridium curvatum]TPX11632.1 hypothetical protein E0L32_007611 [Thyridium curvatum]
MASTTTGVELVTLTKDGAPVPPGAPVVSPPAPSSDSGVLLGSTTSQDTQEAEVPALSRFRTVVIIFQLSTVNFMTSAVTGLVTVGLPTISATLNLPTKLALWPASVTNLTTASTLMIAGAASDVIGPRTVDIAGCFLVGVAILAAAGSQTGEQLVGMRALQGVALSLHLAASVGIVSQSLRAGKARNLAFAFLGLSQPMGFSFGLVTGGIMIDTTGWRPGWWIFGGIILGLAFVGMWALPSQRKNRTFGQVLKECGQKVDWVGAALASVAMALSSYLLAIVSADPHRIREAGSIVILCLAVAAVPAFVYWVHYRVQINKPALIPNSLWKNKAFSTICGTITLSFAVLGSMELFASLFFQEIQHLSALQASIRILPSLIVGTLLNLGTGLVVHRIPALWLVMISSLLCAGGPLLMAVIQPQWTYWANAFVAQLLQPISVDVMFTVGLIIVSETFPEDKQSLAGAVFNTAAQFGQALGLAVMQIVSALVRQAEERKGNVDGDDALFAGYKASFWTMFSFMMLCILLGGIGLRGAGRVGVKRD